MVKWLIENEDFNESEAIDWIDYNTIRTLQYIGDRAPIIMYRLI